MAKHARITDRHRSRGGLSRRAALAALAVGSLTLSTFRDVVSEARPSGDPDAKLLRLHAEWRNAYAALGVLQARARTLAEEERLKPELDAATDWLSEVEQALIATPAQRWDGIQAKLRVAQRLENRGWRRPLPATPRHGGEYVAWSIARDLQNHG
ncbi:Hypothetical protein RADP37_04728 (plasmid) [Roseomonas mucosa]|uniref:Uncharacterized protein n=1 Tax=Roseomonas mucosa TaxID=207340 RepID=A0A4Y1MQ01_9PROT|nr:hypothetical protein [Roseomonas mucosa]AWV20082.1 Hypothetical protein RADP37_04728 [Roseomonas mucosa]MDT8296227.1 hypothetical protein [Roseomonas mucosa]